MWTRLRLACVFLVLLLPVVSAGWRSFGSFEPDTPQDVEGGWMWLDPDTVGDSGVRKVYFNAILVPSQPVVNPNLGAARSRVLLPGFQSPIAFLGVWKDCNADGTIGSLETALFEYRAELLLNQDICPARVGLDVHAPGYTPTHNDGEWVREFLWIGPKSNSANPYGMAPRVINDAGALVWGDEGLPGARVLPVCPVNFPTGTFSSTGALVAYADCHGNHGLADAVNEIDSAASLGLGFRDAEAPQCSDTPLNQRIGLFQDDPRCPSSDAGLLERNSGRRAFTAFDCERGWSVEDGSGGRIAYVPDASPGDVDPHGSLYDSIGAAEGAFREDCGATGEASSVNPAYDAFHPERSITATNVKRETTFYFEFSNDRARSVAGRLVEDEGMPSGLGVASVNQATKTGPTWSSPVAQTSPFVFREQLAPVGAIYYTFYARIGRDVSGSGVQFPNFVGFYGSQWCDRGFGPYVAGGFDCDPERWWKPEHGAGRMPTSYWSGAELGARPGDSYQLRDTDCFDGRFFEAQPMSYAHVSEEGPCRDV